MSTNYLLRKGVSNKMMTPSSNHEFPEKSEGNKKIGAWVSIKIMKSLCIGLVVITGLLFVSCRKYSPQPTAAAPSVYVAGYETISGHSFATLWKDGVATHLNDGTQSAIAMSVYVNGPDVYVAGGQHPGNNMGIATLWRNGVATNLTDGTKNAYTFSVYVNGVDVYVVGGYEQNVPGYGIKFIPTLWKNGVATILTNGTNSGEAYSVYVNGADVYVAGYDNGGAVVWKNGVATNLTDGTTFTEATSVYVNGADVYVAGFEASETGSIAKLWKNGIATNLTDGTHDATVYSVFAK